MAQADEKKPLPPYIPWKTILTLAQSWRIHLPQRIDRSVLGTFSGGAQGGIIAGLRYLGLIDAEGAPTPTLEAFVKSEGPERQKIVARMVRQSYPFLFTTGFDLTKATPSMINEKFQTTGATGDTLSKILSFFTAMAKEGGIDLTPHLKTRQRRTTTAKRTPKDQKAPKNNADIRTQDPADTVTPGMERLPIPGLVGAYIQYPSNLSDANCDLLEAMIGVLRTYAKSRVGKEKKA